MNTPLHSPGDSQPLYLRTRLLWCALVVLAEGVHLGWEQLHGGIPVHHFLHRGDLPGFSSAWGLVLLPVLTWIVSGSVLRRGVATRPSAARVPLPDGALRGFLAALLWGAMLATAFTLGYQSLCEWLFLGVLAAAVVLPVYRGEYLLGFVLGMTLTFGAILPTVIGAAVAAISWLCHRLLWPLLRAGWRRVRRHQP